jgi:predicted alpha/beta-fold hydrolase
MPGQIDDLAFRSIATLEDYDRHYTAPHFGFASTADYYRAASSRYVLGAIRIPTLIVSALDDPFMGPNCIPFDEARENPMVTLETPRHGGHLGFLLAGGGSWIEQRVVEFFAT